MWSAFYSCKILMKPEFSPQSFKEYSNTKFHVNPSSVSIRPRADGWTEGQTDMTKLMFDLSNFTNAPKFGVVCGH